MAKPGSKDKGAPRFFYGWYVVAGMSVVGSMVIAMGGANFGLFIEPMQKAMNTGDTAFGLAQTARIAGVAVSAPLIGRLLDRHGARGPLAVAGFFTGLVVIALAAVMAPWQMVAIFAVLGLLGMQGGIALYTTVPISRWFVRKRGRAMSLTIVGIPIGIAISAPVTQQLIKHVGWQNAWIILGGFGGLVIVIIALAVVRRQPEDKGLLPDGDAPEASAGQAAGGGPGRSGPGPRSHADEYQWTGAEAIRTGAFWRLAVVFGLVMFGQSSMVVFRYPHFVDRGISEQIAAYSLSVEALIGVGVVLLLGLVLDRVRPHYVGVLGFFFLTISYLLTMSTTTPSQMFAASVFLGMGIPIQVTLQNSIWPTYFGKAHVGSIRGASFPITIFFSALGAPLAGIVKDATGEYFVAWWAAIGAFAIGALLLVFTPRPQPKRAVATTI